MLLPRLHPLTPCPRTTKRTVRTRFRRLIRPVACAVVAREDPEIVAHSNAPQCSSGQHRQREEKSGDPTPKNCPPDVANIAGVADVSPVVVAASENAADGDASPPARPRTLPVAGPKWPRRGRGGHHPGTGAQHGRWLRRLRAYGHARRSV